MPFRPLYNAVVLREDPAATDQKVGSIYVPETAQRKEHAAIGTVIAIGNGYVGKVSGELLPLSCKPGDRVVYAAYAGEEHEIEGQKVRIVPEVHVYAVVEP
jgi:chaperonin GroES